MDNKDSKFQQILKQKNLLYISAGVLTVLLATSIILIITGVVSTDFFGYSETEEVEQELKYFESEEEEELPLVETDQGLMFERMTEFGLEDELERTDIMLEGFPSEIPLPGGTLISSSETIIDVSIQMEVNSTAQEAFDWFVNAFSQEGWTILSQTIEEVEEGWFSSSLEYSSVEPEEWTEDYETIRGIVSVTQNNQQQSPIITVSYIFN